MKSTPKTIQIFLPDGNARSIRIAEITSRTVQAIQVPRTKISEAGERDEIKSVGVYFLFGADEETGLPLVYVGEAEDCHTRISQHNKGKGFWESAVAITSKTNSFTKAHVKYLEWYCHQQAVETNRYSLANSTIPTKPYISEQMEADLMDNYETIKVLLSTLGFPVLESVIVKKQPSEMLYCTGLGVKAKGQYTDDGFIIFKGSTCKLKEVKSARTFVTNSRNRILDAKIIERQGNVYVFLKDHLFPSPSQAAVVVLGRSENGWTKWKDANGKTLDELKRK
ncbi:GIY-YIG nuclease family protein [bacterium]|nr:GIY-YIG nuclease family protein [bacterium]